MLLLMFNCNFMTRITIENDKRYRSNFHDCVFSLTNTVAHIHTQAAPNAQKINENLLLKWSAGRSVLSPSIHPTILSIITYYCNTTLENFFFLLFTPLFPSYSRSLFYFLSFTETSDEARFLSNLFFYHISFYFHLHFQFQFYNSKNNNNSTTIFLFLIFFSFVKRSK